MSNIPGRMWGVATTTSKPASCSARSIASPSSGVFAPSSMAATQWQCRSTKPRTLPRNSTLAAHRRRVALLSRAPWRPGSFTTCGGRSRRNVRMAAGDDTTWSSGAQRASRASSWPSTSRAATASARELRWAIGGRSRGEAREGPGGARGARPRRDGPADRRRATATDRAVLDRIARRRASSARPSAPTRSTAASSSARASRRAPTTATHRRAAVRARHDRRAPRARARDRRPHRPLLRVRLDPVGPRDAHARGAGARDATESRCAKVKYFAGEAKGGMSGGTAASMVELMEEATRDRGVRRLLADPYALDPGRRAAGPDGRTSAACAGTRTSACGRAPSSWRRSTRASSAGPTRCSATRGARTSATARR